MTDPTEFDENDAAIAAEYVVGLLPMEDRKTVEDRLKEDPAFARLVSAWQDHFAGLNGDYGTQTPPRRVKSRIDKALFATPSRSFVRWLSGGLSVALVLALLVFASFQWNDAGLPDLRATLTSDDSGYSFAIAVDEDSQQIEVALIDGAVQEGRVFELWLLPDGGVPRSLGVFEAGQTGDVPPTAQLRAGATLAISLEPVGGSPTGAPTGPVVAAGTLNDA